MRSAAKRVSRSGSALGLICFFWLWASPTRAAIVDEDYEGLGTGDILPTNAIGASLVARGWYVGGNCNGYCSATIVTSPFGRTGNVLRYEYRSDQDTEPVPAQDAHNFNLSRTFSPQDEIWARVYFATDVDNTASTAASSLWFCCGTKLHYIKPVGAGPSYVTGFPYHAVSPPGAPVSIYATQEMAVCPSGGTPVFKGGGGCNNVLQNAAAVDVHDKQWYCFEYHVKINSSPTVADGALEMWIDGTKVLDKQNQLMADGHYSVANSRIGSVEVYRQHSNHMLRYEDDFVIDTKRVGCGGPPPDAGHDAGPADVGVDSAAEAGPVDAGPMPDTGRDAGNNDDGSRPGGGSCALFGGAESGGAAMFALGALTVTALARRRRSRR